MNGFEKLSESQVVTHSYHLTELVYQGFLHTFDDRNLLHIDENYAKSKGFKSKVMHGNILNGFLSHFIGMVFPGENVIIHSQSIDYKKPSFIGDQIEIQATVDQLVSSVQTALLKIRLQNKTQEYLCAKGKVQVGFLI